MTAMKWKKLGQVFDPTRYPKLDGRFQFAQSPQALAFDGFVRVYFSTREREPDGMYFSHVAWVDFDPLFRHVVGVSQRPVLSRAGLGCFDEHGVFPFSPIRHGSRLLAYTTGWSRRLSVAVETEIGLAESHDGGETFLRLGAGPVLSASMNEPFLVADGFVRVYAGIFHMWYIFGTEWQHYHPDAAPERTYKIGHATSVDGIFWEKEEARQVVPDILGAQECQALPTVAYIGDSWHMYFCYRQSFDFRTNASRGYRLGYARSHDLLNWTRDDSGMGIGFSESGWDSSMMCYPHLFESGGRNWMLYNGNDFGKMGFGLATLE